jgi:hypothetical protein
MRLTKNFCLVPCLPASGLSFQETDIFWISSSIAQSECRAKPPSHQEFLTGLT